MASMQTHMVVQDAYGIYQVRLSLYEDLKDLGSDKLDEAQSFTRQALQFTKSLGHTNEGVPIEMIIQDIYDVLEAHEYGMSLDHLREHFEGVDIEHHLEMLVNDKLIAEVQMTKNCSVYKIS